MHRHFHSGNGGHSRDDQPWRTSHGRRPYDWKLLSSLSRTFLHIRTPSGRGQWYKTGMASAVAIAVEMPLGGSRDSLGDATQLHQHHCVRASRQLAILLHERALHRLTEDRAASPWHRFHFCKTFKKSFSRSTKNKDSVTLARQSANHLLQVLAFGRMLFAG